MQYFGVFPDNILPFWFIFAISIRWLIGIAGFLLNASLVYVTINSKSLREWCNLLIALNATFAGLFGLSLTAGFALILSGHSFIPQISCFQLQAFPLLFRNLGLNTLFFIALDRLICILFVSWDHRNWLYVCSVAGLSLSHGLFIVFSCLAISLENPFHPTLCSTHDDLYFGPFANTLLTVNVSVSLLIFFAHVALWAVVRVRKNSANGPVIRRLLNSLMVMMGMLVGGFLANNLIQILYVFVVFSDPIKAHISVVMAWLPAMAFASNAPILIAFSTEYRKAYSRQFGPFLKLFCRQTSSMVNTNQSMERRNVSTIRVKSVRNVIGFM